MTATDYRAFEVPDAATGFLAEQGHSTDDDIDLIGAALALAALDRPRVGLGHYVAHMDALVDSVRQRAVMGDPPVAARIEAINAVLFDQFEYVGDTETYDDLQNANLMRVIDRRKGLPIVLGIIYMHVAREAGWRAEGVNFPGHFIVRLVDDGERIIVDPFNRGEVMGAADLRGLLKLTAGDDAELRPVHAAAASSRDILLRLQNNLKLRLIQAGRLDDALTVVDRMLLLAPRNAALWHAAGVLNAELGQISDALEALRMTTELDPDGALKHKVAVLMQSLKKRLN